MPSDENSPTQAQTETEHKRVLPRRIYIHLEDGVHAAPDLDQYCIRSWSTYNPHWKVKVLHHTHLSVEGVLPLPENDWQQIPSRQRGEWVCLWHLANHGGIFVESTSLCLRPLESWIDEVVRPSGFFAFAKNASMPIPANWFMAAFPGNSFSATLLHLYERRLRAFHRWRKAGKTVSGPHWKKNSIIRRIISKPAIAKPTLDRMVQETSEFPEVSREIWNQTPKQPASEPETLQSCGLHAHANDKVRRFLDELPCPIVRIGNDSTKLEGEPDTTMALLLDKNLITNANTMVGTPAPVAKQPNQLHPWHQLLIVGSVRSGTTVFRNILSSARVFTDFGEVVHPDLHGPRNWFFWLAKQGPVHPSEYQNLWPFFISSNKFPKEIALLDIKVEALHLIRDPLSNLPWPPFMMAHPKMETRILRIKRRNTLAQVLSWERLLRTGVAVRMEGVEAASTKIRLSPEEVVEKIQAFQYRDDEADLLIGKADLTVYYEDMFAEDGSLKREVLESCAQLYGMDPNNFSNQPPYKKVARKGDLVNRDEIAEVLKPTPYAWMCDGL